MIRSLSSMFIRATLWLVGSWMLYHSVQISLISAGDGTEIFRFCFLQGTVSNAIIFFGILYLFPRNEGRWSRGFFKQLLLLFFGVTALELLVDHLVLAYIGVRLDFLLQVGTPLVTVASNLVMVGLGLFSGLVLDWFHQHRQAREIREQQVRTELDLLKSRIKPHFLFNVLNGIFFMSQKNGDEETAAAIARLSDMMRYMLYEVSHERVPLAGELAYLENYVAMQRMRLAEAIPISFEVEGDPDRISVPPMLLLPFVENAFKHGVSNARPTPIAIAVLIGDGMLHLTVDNHVHPCAEQETGGFGLESARRRLDLLYPGRHRLEAGEQEGRYRVRLSLETDATEMAPKWPLVLEEQGL